MDTSAAQTDSTAAARTAATRQFEQLALVTLAIVLGPLGFAFSAAWIAAIVVLAVLWGAQASALRATRADGGVVSALVSTAVAEAHSIAEDASTRSAAALPGAQTSEGPSSREPSPDEPTADGPTADGSTSQEPSDDGLTKEELYKEAQEAEVAGRSSMSKAELREALGK